ncbi:hypothetical protein MSAN_02034700 [Mycena sanguinolenta]|uniref:F-box domain-containing protein n=1 Tax=Mycena sanguinolenta TaxID=230812 RepID=A0A8H6XIE4_9AGAR|nr:hypothetical protein MSAN_02034700 [Mycena sanguinolenta]
MRSSNAFPLDDDIVSQIMGFSPDFRTLKAIILVSKAFYRVFQTHPKVITRAVAYTIVGPALPQALRVIRYPYRNYVTQEDGPIPMSAACPEDHGPPVIAPNERNMLEENASVVGKLEDIYSLINKDRMSRTSVLTVDESWRFRRAMYRIMLYCNIFPNFPCDGGDAYLEEDDESLQAIRKLRTAFLCQYLANELQQLASVVRFLSSIFQNCGSDYEPGSDLLATGPSGALRTWETRSYNDLEIHDLDSPDASWTHGYFDIPLRKIWTNRGEVAPSEYESPSKWILDSVNGADDRCSRCASPGGLALFTESNWCRFPLDLTNPLKDQLNHNSTLTGPFEAALTPFLASPAEIERFIAGLFALRRREYDGWEPAHSYCIQCFARFVEDHAWMWFLQQRLRQGLTPPENCWYGWNCRMQTHNLRHAKTKNAALMRPHKGFQGSCGVAVSGVKREMFASGQYPAHGRTIRLST